MTLCFKHGTVTVSRMISCSLLTFYSVYCHDVNVSSSFQCTETKKYNNKQTLTEQCELWAFELLPDDRLVVLLFNCTASSPTRLFVQHSVMNFPVPLYCLSPLQQQGPMQKNRARICRITTVMKTKVFSTVNRGGAWRLAVPLLLVPVSDHLAFVFWFIYFFSRNQPSIIFLGMVIKWHHQCASLCVCVFLLFEGLYFFCS